MFGVHQKDTRMSKLPVVPKASISTATGGLPRRSLIVGGGAALAGLGLAATPVWAQAAKKAAPKKAAAPASPNQPIVDATRRCETVGKICLNHCIRLTKAGDKSIADCMRAVNAMLPVCSAMNRLAALDAKRLKDLAKVCADVCRDCEAECRKHEFHHVECKNCAEACAATVKVLASL
jgi:Cys-rich four helix bundle protein (predicted Tat secretion target)